MEKCIIIPDSFKGTMSAMEVSNMIESEVGDFFPQCEIHSIPIADGGEGTVDCFVHALGGKKTEAEVTGPFGEKVQGFYGTINDIAIIEMAAAAGMAYGRRDPVNASTYGVGELICHAIDSGHKRIILGLGGSCTNDAGAGMAAALGTKFTDRQGNTLLPVGGDLGDVVRINNEETERRLKGIQIEAMCDINNPMYGPKGAACVFGPQKGADQKTVALLDKNLRCFSRAITRNLCMDVSGIPGSGSAGGMGAGVCAFLGGKLVSGIELLLDVVGFDMLLDHCDVVFTGEGRLDHQSFGGKVISGVAKRAQGQGIPVVAVVGCMEKAVEPLLKQYGIHTVYPVYDQPVEIDQIRASCKKDLKEKTGQMLQDIRAGMY